MTEQQPVRNIADLINAGSLQQPERQLDATAKEALAKAGTPFTITRIDTANDPEYGECWDIYAQLPDGPVNFRLYANERRDPFITSLATALVSGPITGLRLMSTGTRKGNAFVWLDVAS
jgi:hypothetical protein